jgi:hypothetical protein
MTDKDVTMASIPTLLLGLTSLILGFAGVAHAVAFRRATSAVASSGLMPFFSGTFLSLWLIDSANCLVLAALFGYVAAHPSPTMRPVVLALALMPAASAILIYKFLGSFYAGHLLLAAAVAAFLAAATLPSNG